MEPLEYLHLQMRLEGIGVLKGCLLRQVELVPGEELSWMLIAQFANQELVAYYDEAMPSGLQKELAGLVPDLKFPKIGPLLDVLRLNNIRCETGHYKTYVFPARPEMNVDVLCLSKHDPAVKAFGFDGFADQVYAIERNGALVSACVSMRENEMCGEVWVYTTPEYRRHGFAQKTVNAWAESLLGAGKVPFYSHDIKNEASASLAGNLGLLPVFEEITITKI